jgi:hypothetical protein
VGAQPRILARLRSPIETLIETLLELAAIHRSEIG